MFDSTKLMSTSDDFVTLRESNSYFVDKTLLIKKAVKNSCDSTVLTRPKGFGKTTFLTMMKAFLDVDVNNPYSTEKQQKLFAGTKIIDDKEFCQKYMGQYPCIYLSLKDVKGRTYEDAYQKFAETVYESAKSFAYLLDSPKLSEHEKEDFKRYLNPDYLKDIDNAIGVDSYVRRITSLLNHHFDRYVFQFIDDYEIPVLDGKKHCYLNEISYLIGGMLWCIQDEYSSRMQSYVCATNSVGNEIMSRQLSHSRRSNVEDWDLSTEFSFGFTPKELDELLKSFSLSEHEGFIEENFGGYELTDGTSISPFDVVNFVNDRLKKKKLSENLLENKYVCDLLKDEFACQCVKSLIKNHTPVIQDLVDGSNVTFEIVQYWDTECYKLYDDDSCLTILLHKGWLTKLPLERKLSGESYNGINLYSNSLTTVKIPNEKMLVIFEKLAENFFNENFLPFNEADKIANALFNGDDNYVQTELRDRLKSFISLKPKDSSYQAVSYYHEFMETVFNCCSKSSVQDNVPAYEVGDGYVIITFKDLEGERAVLIKIVTSEDQNKSRIDLADTAIAQIEEDHYVKSLIEDENITSIYLYGMAFYRKACSVRVKQVM